MTMPLDQRITDHRDLVLALRDNGGIDPPPQWSTLDQRPTNLLELQSPTVDRLKKAVADGADNDELIQLRAEALAEISALPTFVAQLNNAIADDIYRKMLDAYAKHAQANYQQVAAEFDSAAKSFTDCVAIVDPDSPAEELVIGAAATDETRKAWADAALHAARLGQLSVVLATAAELAGVSVGGQPFDGARLALVADAASSTRAELFTAWNCTTGRTTRWGALLKARAHLRAHPLDGFKAYHPDDDKPPPQLEPFDPVVRRRSGRAVVV
jgi:hypothetical protein